MAFSFAVLAPVALQEPLRSHKRTLERCWKGVLSIGGCMALNIALNNISLLDVSLTLNQIIRWVDQRRPSFDDPSMLCSSFL